MDERLHYFLLQEGNFSITKNYRGIILSAIAANVCNTLLFIHIQKSRKFLGKIKTAFREIDPHHRFCLLNDQSMCKKF